MEKEINKKKSMTICFYFFPLACILDVEESTSLKGTKKKSRYG
jgi:hypothetical protein